MSPFVDNHDAQLSERELAIANSRSALRAEREQVSVDRAEAERLLSEARDAVAAANRYRERSRKLAIRFVRNFKCRHARAEREFQDKTTALADERKRFDSEVAHFEKARSDFHTNAIAVRSRLHDAWTAVRTQQKRVVREWSEVSRRLAEENATLKARAQELTQQEQKLADTRARIEAETAGFREEATSLEARIEHTRISLAELDEQRNRILNEFIGVELPASLPLEATAEEALAEPVEEEQQDRTDDNRPTQEQAELKDRERLVVEQLAMLQLAREKWQAAEQQTVSEMEQLGRDLDQREHDLDAHEQRLIRSGMQQRENAFALWQLRLRLEAWQTRLTASEARFRSEREQYEADFVRRVGILSHRETELDETLRNLESARMREREQLLGELELWADDRKRLEHARIDFDRQRIELLDELSRHASQALAAEEQLSKLVPEQESALMERRVRVLRRRWEWLFQRRLREIAHERAELSSERTRLEERYRELHGLLRDVLEQAANLKRQEDAQILLHINSIPELTVVAADTQDASPTNSYELKALRNEIERLATMILEIELPENSDRAVQEIPWATEAPPNPSSDLLPFDSGSWAA